MTRAVALHHPDTFVLFSHAVTWSPRDADEWDAAALWCDERFGELGQGWCYQLEPMRLPHRWWFASEEHAVLFKLTWC